MYKKKLLLLGIVLSIFLAVAGCNSTVAEETSSQQKEINTEEASDTEPETLSDESVEDSVGSKESTIEDISVSNEEKIEENAEVGESEIKIPDILTNKNESAYILDKLYEKYQDNVVFSPLSLNMCLGLLSKGAADETKKELNTYLEVEDYDSKAARVIDNYYDYDMENLENADSKIDEMHSSLVSAGFSEDFADENAEILVSCVEGMSKDPYTYVDESFNTMYSSLSSEDCQKLDEIIESEINDLIISSYESAFNVANSLWLDKKYTFKDDFKQIADLIYYAEVSNIDVSNPSESAEIINSWCSDKTNGKIDNIINEGNITPLTAMIALNTVYFYSQWLDAPWNETDMDFTRYNGEVNSVDAISNEVNSYYEDDEAEAFMCRYMNGMQFIGILPKDEKTAISSIDIEKLLASDKTDDYSDIYATMPKIKYDTDNEILKDTLCELGLSDVFDQDKADFSELFNEYEEGETSVWIDDIIQKCTIELDENGTEASAATAAMMNFATSAPGGDTLEPKYIELNRPYYFIIMDTETDQIAFMGKVVNP